MSLALGITGAFFCAKRRFPLRNVFLSFYAIPLCLPALLAVLGCVGMFGMHGSVNFLLIEVFRLKKTPSTFLYSFLGIVTVQGFYNFPIIMKNVCDSWLKIPKDLSDSARLLGAGESRIFLTVTLNQLLPSIFSSAIIVFLFCFFSFLIILLFSPPGFSTLEVELFLQSRNISKPGKAIFIAATETVIAMIFVAFFAFLEKKGGRNKEFGIINPQRKKISEASAPEKLFFLVYILIVVIGFLLPLLSIFFNAFKGKGGGFSLENFMWIIRRRNFIPSCINTLFIGFCSAFGASAIGTALALFFFTKKHSTAAKIFSFLPMAISTAAIGFICLLIFKKGSAFILIMSEIFLYWPYAFRMTLSSLQKTPEEVVESAKILCKNRFISAFSVYIPMTKREIFSSFFFCFCLSAGDVTLPLVLALPRFSSLALDTYRLSSAYRFREAYASGSILFAITAMLYVLSASIKGRKIKIEGKK